MSIHVWAAGGLAAPGPWVGQPSVPSSPFQKRLRKSVSCCCWGAGGASRQLPTASQHLRAGRVTWDTPMPAVTGQRPPFLRGVFVVDKCLQYGPKRAGSRGLMCCEGRSCRWTDRGPGRGSGSCLCPAGGGHSSRCPSASVSPPGRRKAGGSRAGPFWVQPPQPAVPSAGSVHALDPFQLRCVWVAGEEG